jgi:hypothetical protein
MQPRIKSFLISPVLTTPWSETPYAYTLPFYTKKTNIICHKKILPLGTSRIYAIIFARTDGGGIVRAVIKNMRLMQKH